MLFLHLPTPHNILKSTESGINKKLGFDAEVAVNFSHLVITSFIVGFPGRINFIELKIMLRKLAIIQMKQDKKSSSMVGIDL